MTDQQHLFEQIETYLHDRMSEKERIAFEHKLAVDEGLASKVNEARAIDDAIHFACLADLKKTVGEDIKKIKHTSTWKDVRYWLIGSAILIAASAGFFTFTKNSEETIAVVKPERKNIPTEKITPDKKQDSVGKELTTGKRTNPPAFISASKETEDDTLKNNEPSEVMEKTIGKNTDRQTTRNEETKVSSVAKGNEDKKTTSNATPEVKNNCMEEFDIKIEPSCKHKENGSITISAGGGKELTFKVDQFASNGSIGVFPNLSPGEHKVLVTYNKECTFAKTVTIEEKWCPLNSSFSFNPDYHEKWEIRYDEGAEGKFIIYDRSGKVVYKNTFGSGNEHWNGTDMNGSTAPMGNYAAILYYSDGRKEKVDLTIVR